MSRRFRSSKFRHVKASFGKGIYRDLAPFTSGSGNLISSSARYISVVSGTSGSNVNILPIDTEGSRGTPKFAVRGHAREITDVQWSDCADNIMITCCDDGSVKLWEIPSGGLVEDLVVPQQELKGHTKKVYCAAFHPTSSEIVATASLDKSAVVWDCKTGERMYTLAHPDAVYSVFWDAVGQRLATLCKDGAVRVYNVRASTEPLHVYTGAHNGQKPYTGCWLSADRFVTVGLNKMRSRELCAWDTTQQDKPIKKVTIDSGTGILRLFFDFTCNLLFVGGKGDSSIRCFEVDSEKPFLHALETAGKSDPQQGVCLLPKRAVDVGQLEAARLYRLEKGAVVPLSYTVPRKLKVFDREVFPDAPSGTSVCTAEEWRAGACPPVPLSSMDPSSKPEVVAEKIRELRERVAAEQAQAIAEEKEKYAPADYAKVKVVRSSNFRHVFGKPVPKREFVTGVAANNTSGSNSLIQANQKYLAVPYAGPGGRLAVLPVDFSGRLNPSFGMLETGSTPLDFKWSTFHPDILVTGHDDAKLKVWKIPEGGIDITGENHTVPEAQLQGHRRKIETINFSRNIDNLLASTDSNYDIKVWDLDSGNGKPSLSIDVHSQQIYNVDWSYTSSLFATISADKKIRVIDPRSASVSMEMDAHDTGKTSCVMWKGDSDQLISTGFGKGSARQINLYDWRKGSLLKSLDIDVSNGAFTSHFDAGNSLLYLAGRGDMGVKFFEINDDAPFIHYCSNYSGPKPQLDVAFLPKQSVNVAEVESMRMLQLLQNSIETVKITVPRTRKEYFQDDLYPDYPSITVASATAAEYLSAASEDFFPILESMQPANMSPVSEAPEIVKEKKVSSRHILAKLEEIEETGADPAEAVFNKIAGQWKEEGETEVDKGGEEADAVDSDEW